MYLYVLTFVMISIVKLEICSVFVYNSIKYKVIITYVNTHKLPIGHVYIVVARDMDTSPNLMIIRMISLCFI